MDDLLVIVALGLAVAVALLSSLGLALGATAHDRLHFLGPPGLAAVLLAIALWIDSGPSLIALKATLLAFIVVVTSPITTHVIARSALIRETGDWRWRERRR